MRKNESEFLEKRKGQLRTVKISYSKENRHTGMSYHEGDYQGKWTYLEVIIQRACGYLRHRPFPRVLPVC